MYDFIQVRIDIKTHLFWQVITLFNLDAFEAAQVYIECAWTISKYKERMQKFKATGDSRIQDIFIKMNQLK